MSRCRPCSNPSIINESCDFLHGGDSVIKDAATLETIRRFKCPWMDIRYQKMDSVKVDRHLKPSKQGSFPHQIFRNPEFLSVKSCRNQPSDAQYHSSLSICGHSCPRLDIDSIQNGQGTVGIKKPKGYYLVATVLLIINSGWQL